MENNKFKLYKKKKIAALTGVLYYLKNEETEKEDQNKIRVRLNAQHNSVSPWASYNRQSIMQMRSLMQRGIIRKKF